MVRLACVIGGSGLPTTDIRCTPVPAMLNAIFGAVAASAFAAVSAWRNVHVAPHVAPAVSPVDVTVNVAASARFAAVKRIDAMLAAPNDARMCRGGAAMTTLCCGMPFPLIVYDARASETNTRRGGQTRHAAT